MCGKYALQGSSRALYTPLDSTHKECTWPVPFQEVGFAVLIGSWVVKDSVLWSVVWSGLVVWPGLFKRWIALSNVWTTGAWCRGGGLLIWWSDWVVESDDGLLCIRMWWSDLGSDLIVCCGGVTGWFQGGWSGLTAENWKYKKLR